jgi:hypothetical protein
MLLSQISGLLRLRGCGAKIAPADKEDMRLPFTATIALTSYIVALLSFELCEQHVQGISIQDLAKQLKMPPQCVSALIRAAGLISTEPISTEPSLPMPRLRSTCRGYTAAA